MVIVYFCLIMAAYTIQTAFGFAGTAIIMPLLILLLGSDLAVALMGILGLLACLSVVVKEWRWIQKTAVFQSIPIMCLGMIGGFLLKYFVTYKVFVIFYSLIIMLISSLMYKTSGKIKIHSWMEWTMLLTAGILHAIFVCGGPLLVLIMMNTIENKRTFRATISMMWVITNSLLVIQHLALNLYTKDFGQFFFPGLAALGFGIIAGNIIHGKLTQQKFMKFGSILLFMSGLCMLIGII